MSFLSRLTAIPFILTGFSLLFMVAFARAEVPAELNDTLVVYRQAESMILEVRKTVKMPALEKETVFKGMIKLLKGKFYWDTTEPEKNLLIYDGKVLWNVQYPPAEFKEAPLQVAKIGVKGKNKSPLILSEVFGSRPLDQIFEAKQKSKDGGLVSFQLKPKKDDLNLTNITLKIDTKAQRVVSLEYLDEVENETKLDFRSTQFNIKIRSGLFDYKPPKNAKVTEY